MLSNPFYLSFNLDDRFTCFLRVDATYFKQFCLLCYQDHHAGYTQLIRFSDGEHYQEIKEDLNNLINLGLQIESITTDGHKSILKAIKKAMPDVIVQRCLVHIQRMCLLWLTQYPKHIAGVELRSLVLMIQKIKTDNDHKFWTIELDTWYKRHEEYLCETTVNQQTGRHWYTHKLLRRSYFTLKEHFQTCFIFCPILKYQPPQTALKLKNHLDLPED